VYELGGVIVHRGTARNGHYFSLVRERGTAAGTAAGTGTGTGTAVGAPRWYHIDDDKVTLPPPTWPLARTARIPIPHCLLVCTYTT